MSISPRDTSVLSPSRTTQNGASRRELPADIRAVVVRAFVEALTVEIRAELKASVASPGATEGESHLEKAS